MKNEFDEHLLRKEQHFNTLEDLIEVMDYFYFKIFMLFNEKWVDAKVGIMEFNQFLERVYEQDFLPFYYKYLVEYLDNKLAYKKPY